MSADHLLNRRRFIAGSVAAAAARSVVAADETSEFTDFVLAPPDLVSLRIKDSSSRIEMRRICCLGRNYRARAIESGDNPDETPPFSFIKPGDAISDSRDGFPYPPMTKALRYEVETVVALKSGGSNIDPAEALDYFYGYGYGLVV